MSTSPTRPVATFSRILLEFHGEKKMVLLIRFASCEGYCNPGIAGGQLGHPVERASKKEAEKMENSLELRKRKIPEEIICIPESHHA